MNEDTLTLWAPAITSCPFLKGSKAAYIVEKPQSQAWNCNGSDIIWLYCCLKKHYISWPGESAQNIFCDMSLQLSSNFHPAFCWIEYFSWQKCHCQELEDRTDHRYWFLNRRIRLIICGEVCLSKLKNPSKNAKIVNCNWRDSLSQNNQFSNVFEKTVSFSFSLIVVPSVSKSGGGGKRDSLSGFRT